MPFECDCGCVCGLCEDMECHCECHLLCTLSDEDLKELCVFHGLAKADASHRRNTLFKHIYESEDPIQVLEYGIKHYVLGQKLTVPKLITQTERKQSNQRKAQTIRKPARKPARKSARKPATKARCVDSDG